jgi:hypothetical protein
MVQRKWFQPEVIFKQVLYNVCAKRLCRPMCGKALPFRHDPWMTKEAAPPKRGRSLA